MFLRVLANHGGRAAEEKAFHRRTALPGEDDSGEIPFVARGKNVLSYVDALEHPLLVEA